MAKVHVTDSRSRSLRDASISQSSTAISRTFNTLIETDSALEIPAKRRKPLGVPIESVGKEKLLKMKKDLVCKQIKYKIRGVIKKLEYQDIVMLKDGQIGPVTKLFKDGHFCFGQTKRFFKLSEIQLNLTIVTPEEQKLLDRNRFWYEGQKVEVYSASTKSWCPGEILRIFHINDQDPLTVHPTKWYQLKYDNGEKWRFKQLIWYSQDIRPSVDSQLDFQNDDDDSGSVTPSQHSICE